MATHSLDEWTWCVPNQYCHMKNVSQEKCATWWRLWVSWQMCPMINAAVGRDESSLPRVLVQKCHTLHKLSHFLSALSYFDCHSLPTHKDSSYLHFIIYVNFSHSAQFILLARWAHSKQWGFVIIFRAAPAGYFIISWPPPSLWFQKRFSPARSKSWLLWQAWVWARCHWRALGLPTAIIIRCS